MSGENFEKAIVRSMDSCQTSGIAISNHFREVTKLITAGKGAKRSVKDYMLTRYACYLIAQNNFSVRSMLGERGIKPEELPPFEDLKKLERRVKSQEKKIAKQSGKFPAADDEET